MLNTDADDSPFFRLATPSSISRARSSNFFQATTNAAPVIASGMARKKIPMTMVAVATPLPMGEMGFTSP